MATIVPDSLALADVQAAIDGASDGDVILASFADTQTYTSALVLPSTKSLTLRGAGPSTTKIIDGTGTGFTDQAIRIESGATTHHEIDGFDFDCTAGSSWGTIAVRKSTFGGTFRITNCNFHDLVTRGITNTDVYGVIDHNNFSDHADGTCQAVSLFGGGSTSWTRALTLGTANAVYVEDNTFTYTYPNDGAIDAYNGARLVFRHNTCVGATFGVHGFDSGGYRGVCSWEVSNNTFTAVEASQFIGNIRSGTGVYFNNTFTGFDMSTLAVTNYRSDPTFCDHPTSFTWPLADGSTQYDGNTAIETATHDGGNNATTFSDSSKSWTTNQWQGYYLRNTTDGSAGYVISNTATDISVLLLSGGTDNDFDDGDTIELSNGWPTRDQIGRSTDTGEWTAQASAPAHFWNNTQGGTEYGAQINTGNVSATVSLETATQDGGDNQSVLTDSSKSWTVNELVGKYIRNVTDGSRGQIAANTATTVSATMYGGDGDFDDGDLILITDGVPAVTDHVQENRDFYNTEDTEYTEYTYPHPLNVTTGGGGGGSMNTWTHVGTQVASRYGSSSSTSTGIAVQSGDLIVLTGVTNNAAAAVTGFSDSGSTYNWATNLRTAVVQNNAYQRTSWAVATGAATLTFTVTASAATTLGIRASVFRPSAAGTVSVTVVGTLTEYSSGTATIPAINDSVDASLAVAVLTSNSAVTWTNHEIPAATAADGSVAVNGNACAFYALLSAANSSLTAEADMSAAGHVSGELIVFQSEAAATTYTVTYDGNTNDSGTAPTDASSPYAEGDTVTVLGNTGSLAKTGHTFAGWNTAANGSGTAYDPSDTFSMPASNVTLYAQWTESSSAYSPRSPLLVQREPIQLMMGGSA